MKVKKTVIVTKDNMLEMMKIFNDFLEMNSERIFELKRIWGVAGENETWESYPFNHFFSTIPKVEEYRNSIVPITTELFSLQITSEEDVKTFLFSGVSSWLREHYPGRINFDNQTFNIEIVNIGDRVILSEEGITVIPRKPKVSYDKICSWMLAVVSTSNLLKIPTTPSI